MRTAFRQMDVAGRWMLVEFMTNKLSAWSAHALVTAWDESVRLRCVVADDTLVRLIQGPTRIGYSTVLYQERVDPPRS